MISRRKFGKLKLERLQLAIAVTRGKRRNTSSRDVSFLEQLAWELANLEARELLERCSTGRAEVVCGKRAGDKNEKRSGPEPYIWVVLERQLRGKGPGSN
jgi:hypothetical protein